jgi:hypothetical protein
MGVYEETTGVQPSNPTVCVEKSGFITYCIEELAIGQLFAGTQTTSQTSRNTSERHWTLEKRPASTRQRTTSGQCTGVPPGRVPPRHPENDQRGTTVTVTLMTQNQKPVA